MPDSPFSETLPPDPSSFGASIGNVLTVTVHSAALHLYTVTEDQMDSLSSGSWQIYANLASVCFGSFISLIGIFFAGFTNPSFMRTALSARATMAALVLCVLFVIMALSGYWSHRRLVKQIKERKSDAHSIQ
ncbi:MAG: hypothetical protein OXE17_02065 [Chloroflexi bacterium]|nr:hypothetical protein [Chloroflexota bacterium]